MTRATVVIFLAVVVAVLGLAHLYFWRRLAKAPAWPRPARRALGIAFVALPLVALAGLSAPRWIPPEKAGLVEWVGGLWAGVTFLLLVLLALSDLGRLAGWIARRATTFLSRKFRAGRSASRDDDGTETTSSLHRDVDQSGAELPGRPKRGPPFDADRRRLLARTIAGGVGVATAGVATAAVAEAASGPAIVDVEVPIERLPAALEGFRIVQLTDLHVGGLRGRDFVADVVARTNALSPDVVAITGDLADGPVDALAPLLAPLADLKPAHGSFFVTGNHEYFWGVEALLAEVARLGVRVLRNERVEVRRGDAALDVAGIDDATASRFGGGHGADIDAAMRGRDTERPVVLLAHQPRQVDDGRRHAVDLVLSGHTHGGQIFPFGLLVRLVQPAVRGLHRFGPTWLYVSAGTGAWGPPMRLGAPSEITRITLHRGANPRAAR